ncbi:MAG: polyphosphate kinase 2 [Candidatus Gracilibacteria bacterium]|nr:polyphosphate kinase 2 [Candidatus Gracilibacteria bacterium]
MEEEEEKKEKLKLIDVVKEVEKGYKKCENVPNNQKDEYLTFCVKKNKVKYEKELIKLQVELLKLQKHIKNSGEKLLIIFEGRDAAGKGGTIKRFTEYLNPRGARVVALEKPSDVEKTQWYFQRYINHLPSGGEMTFFDRSWYNRAGVEPVMGFVSEEKYKKFLKDTPLFEKMLVDSKIKIIKFYFSVSKDEQAKRFEGRKYNPLKQFKLSPIDQFSQQLWKKYTLAEYKNFSHTHSKDAPWIIVNSDDKKQARINAIKYVLNQFDYPEKIKDNELKIDKNIIMTGKDKVKILEKEIDVKDDLFE